MDAQPLIDALREISGQITPDQLPARLVSATLELTGARQAALLLDGSDERFAMAARGTRAGARVSVESFSPLAPPDERLPLGVVEEVRRIRAPVAVTDEVAGSAHCFPLLGRTGILGALYVVADGDRRISADRLTAMEFLVTQAAAILDGALVRAGLEQENTELRQREEALRRSEDLYRRAIVQAGAVPYVLDYATNSYTFMGEAIEELTGYAPAEFTPAFWEEMAEESILLGDQSGLDDEEAVERTRSGEFPRWRCDQRVRTRTGESRWISDASVEILGEDGRSIGSIGMLQDITERKQMELERVQLAAVLEATTDVVGMADPRGVVLYLNRAGRRLLGIGDGDDLSSTSIADYHPAWAATLVLEEGVPTAIRDGAWTAETALLARDGREIPVSQVLVAHKVDDEVRFFSTIARDIRERRNLEEQLRQAQKMEAIGRLAGGIAHDFNNLLTAIGGYSLLVLDRLEAGDPLRRDVEEIQKAGERAASLTQQLLAFSRRQVLQPHVLDLNSVVAEAEALLRRLIPENIRLVTHLDRKPVAVNADPGQLGQVIVNLVVNARDAMPNGGRLTIETARIQVEDRNARGHMAMEPAPYALLSVSDTGAGMDPETQAHIFEPFFTTKIGTGTGLGLATVFGIVEQSGGQISVQSEPGHGSTFTVYLPNVSAVPVPLPSARRATDVAVGHESILLVEDDTAVRALARDVLRLSGYRVVDAADATEAERLAEQWEGPLDLLITDVIMPGTSGRTLADRLAVTRPRLRVLFVSGYTGEALFRFGALGPAQGFLQKPFTPDLLVRKVRELLDDGER